jgi:hypothetical protein
VESRDSVSEDVEARGGACVEERNSLASSVQKNGKLASLNKGTEPF